MTTKNKTKDVPKCKKPADLTDKTKVNTDLGKWWRQFCFNHISIIPGSFPKRRPFPKRPVEESGFTAMIRPPYQIYNVELVDANGKNDFKSRRVDHIVKKMQKSASAAQNGYKEHTNIFKHNTSGAESLQRYREVFAYSRHRLAKINRKRLRKVVQMVKSSGHKEEKTKFPPKRYPVEVEVRLPKDNSKNGRLQTKEEVKGQNNATAVNETRPPSVNDSSIKSQSSEKVSKPRSTQDAPPTPIRSETATSTQEARSKSILDGLPPGTYTKRITFIKSPPTARPVTSEPLKVTSVDFPDESTVSRKANPLGRVINQTFTISTKITKVSNEIQGSQRKDETNEPSVNTNPSLPLLRRLKMQQQQTPQFKYTERINLIKSRLTDEADESSSQRSSVKKPPLAKFAYRDDKIDPPVYTPVSLPKMSDKNRQMFERLTKSPPAKDVFELTQRFLDKHKKL